MELKNVNANLQERTREQLKQVKKEESKQKEEKSHKLINKLSPSLKEELLLHTIEDFLREVVNILIEKKFTDGETILVEGELDSNFQIILNGEVELFSQNRQLDTIAKVSMLKVLIWIIVGQQKGDFIGEMGFIAEFPANLSAKCKGFVTILLIKREDFTNLLKRQPADLEQFCMIRDKIKNYHDNFNLFLRCGICTKCHSDSQCPLLHYIPDSELIIKKFNQSISQQRIYKTRKNNVLSIHTLSNLSKTQQSIESLQNEAWFEEKSLQSFGNFSRNGLVSWINSQGEQEIYFETFEDATSENNILNSNQTHVKTNPNWSDLLWIVSNFRRECSSNAIDRFKILNVKTNTEENARKKNSIFNTEINEKSSESPIHKEYLSLNPQFQINPDEVKPLSPIPSEEDKEIVISPLSDQNEEKNIKKPWDWKNCSKEGKIKSMSTVQNIPHQKRKRQDYKLTEDEILCKFEKLKDFPTQFPSNNCKEVIISMKNKRPPKLKNSSQKQFMFLENLPFEIKQDLSSPESQKAISIRQKGPQNSQITEPKHSDLSKTGKTQIFQKRASYFVGAEQKNIGNLFELVKEMKKIKSDKDLQQKWKLNFEKGHEQKLSLIPSL